MKEHIDSKFQHFIDLNDYSIEWRDSLIRLALEIKSQPEKFSESCRGKVLGTLFYEPSTRTQMSFQTAMLRLGGQVIGFDNPLTSSVAKGENLKDTTKIISSYADLAVMRHNLEGSVKAAAISSDCPFINAGDGSHLHPTQTLTDLLTLSIHKKRLDNLTIGICGDLANGRTAHSLIKAMSWYSGNHFILISTEELRLPAYVKDYLKASNCTYEEVFSLESALPKLDVLYMTRIQKERFVSEEAYLAQKDTYILTREKLLEAKPDLAILHPLPRVDEIAIEVDNDPRALYFQQAKNGVFVRMALILTMLNHPHGAATDFGHEHTLACCKNPKCVTHTEVYLPHLFYGRGSGDFLTCSYCDERILCQ